MVVETRKRKASGSSSKSPSVEVAPPKKLKLSTRRTKSVSTTSSSTSRLANKTPVPLSITGGTFTTPDWLPDGLTMVVSAKATGQKFKVYKETATGKKFYSKPQVLNYFGIAHGSNSNKRKVDTCLNVKDMFNLGIMHLKTKLVKQPGIHRTRNELETGLRLLKQCMLGKFFESDKVMKLSSGNNDVTKQDFISKLPDTLLTYIISLLPEADACRTSVLSNRWKDLWMFLPNLHFVIPNSSTREQASEYYDLVENTLAIRDGLPIRRLFIYWSQVYNIPCVEKWLRIAVERKVQILVLRPILFLERQELDYLETITISSISLKRLRIYNTVDVYNEFVIDAPKLEYLYIEDKKEYGCDYSFTNKPSSLVEAYIDTNTDSVDQIFTNISAVKVLTLTSPTIRAFNEVHEIDELDELNGLNVPIYPNLVKLVIDMHDILNWRLLFVFLHNMPNLEHITFLNGLLPSQNARRIFHRYWNPPLETPACLRFKLKEIIILNQEGITQEELMLIWYMLNHSDNLEILTVNGHELDPMRLEVLLKFHRGSNLCRFEIV
ncbi:F-box/RNI-like/FBD-like domains-containing protein [Tanacetum coccineum]